MKTTLAGVPIFVGASVLIFGWYLGMETFTNVCCDYVSMKGATAVGMILSGLIVLMLIDKRPHVLELSIVTFALSLQVAGMVLSQVSAFDYATKFINVSDMSHYTIEAHLPSLGTMLGFLFVVVAAFSRLMHLKCNLCGLIIASIGSVGLVGYLFSNPLLYFYVPGLSTGMALHTALCFTMLGLVLRR